MYHCLPWSARPQDHRGSAASRRLRLVALPMLSVLSACSLVGEEPLPVVDELPANGGVILSIAVDAASREAAQGRSQPRGVFVVNPVTGEMMRWSAPDTLPQWQNVDYENAAWSPDRDALILPLSQSDEIITVSRRGVTETISLAPLEADPSDATDTGAVDDVSVSPDGRSIAYRIVSLPADQSAPGLFVKSMIDGAVLRVADRASITTAAWSGDGSELAYTLIPKGTWYLSPAERHMDLHRIRADGTAQREIAPMPMRTHQLFWSPAGPEMAYIAPTDEANPWAVWLTNSNGSRPKSLFEVPEPTNEHDHGYGVRQLAWSPDGRQLVLAGDWESDCRYASGYEGDRLRLCSDQFLYLIEKDGTNLRRLTDRQVVTSRLIWIDTNSDSD